MRVNAYQEKREAILQTAAKIFAHKGYYGSGLQEILAACGIPKGSFYHYFPGGKEELAVELVRYAYERMEQGIQARLFSRSNDAVYIFSHMARHLAQRVTETDNQLVSLLMTFLGIESVYISPRLSRACADVYTRWQELYRNKLLLGGYDEEMARALSLSLFALVHGALISSWIKQDPSDLLAMEKTVPLLLPPPASAPLLL